MAFRVLASLSGGNAWPGRAGNPEQALWNPLALKGEAGREGDPPLGLTLLSVCLGPGVLVLLIPRLGTGQGVGYGLLNCPLDGYKLGHVFCKGAVSIPRPYNSWALGPRFETGLRLLGLPATTHTSPLRQ